MTDVKVPAAASAAAFDSKEDSLPHEKAPPPRARGRQWTAALTANLIAVCCGIATAWSSPTLPALQDHEKDVGSWAGGWVTSFLPSKNVTDNQGALVASLVPLGALVGALPAGEVARRWGSKRPLLALAGIFTIGWVLILLAGVAGVGSILAGRALHGLATGAATVMVPRYCEEISEVAIRGMLGALLDFSMCNGVLLSYILGLVVPYALLTLVCAAVPLIFAATFFFMPESPVYLSRIGERESALKALTWLRPGWNSSQLENELDILTGLEVAPNEISKDVEGENSQKPRTYNLCGISFTAGGAKSLFVVYALMIFQQLTGISSVIAYSTDIFDKVNGALEPRVATVMLGALQSLGGVVAAFTVEHAGRRMLLLISSIIMCITLAITAADVQSVPWLILVALSLFPFAIEIGFGPIPWFINAELLDATASGTSVSVNWAMAFTVTEVFPLLEKKYSVNAVFAGYAILTGIATIFTFFLVPETRGKTRAQLRKEMESWPRISLSFR